MHNIFGIVHNKMQKKMKTNNDAIIMYPKLD